jgi:hypothetical protein
MKVCTRCQQSKENPDFYIGYRVCKECKKSEHALRMRYEEGYAEKRKLINRRSNLRVYGITPEEYTGLLEKQSGACAICLSFSSKVTRAGTLHVDHNHTTGAVRGLLCHHCNTSLGSMSDSPLLLRRAAEYIERSTIIPITFEELKEIVSERYDPDEVVDLLQLTTEQLLAAFPDELESNRHKFKEDG